jgi:hypothetical protein
MAVTIATMYTAMRECSVDFKIDLSVVFFSIIGVVGCRSNEEVTVITGDFYGTEEAV